MRKKTKSLLSATYKKQKEKQTDVERSINQMIDAIAPAVIKAKGGDFEESRI